MAGKVESKSNQFTLAERLVFGNFSLEELFALKGNAKTRGYEDLKTGRLWATKYGTRNLVPGPIAALYLDGLPMPRDPLAYVSACRKGEPINNYEPAEVIELPPRRQSPRRTVSKLANKQRQLNEQARVEIFSQS